MSTPLFRKKGSSRYWCRVPNPNGGRHLRHSTGHSDREAAMREWRRLCRESALGPDQAKNETTVSAALAARVENRRAAGRAPQTLDALEQKARQVVRVLGADTLLSSVDASAVDGYVTTRLDEGAKRTTVAKELSALRGAIKVARRQKKHCAPVDEVMPEFSVRYKPKERALSEHEIALLLRELLPHRAAVVAFIVATSATYPSEVQHAVRADVDLKRWMVHLRGTKTETRKRDVPIPEFARGWLSFALERAAKKGSLFAPWPSVRRDLHAAARRLSLCPSCRDAHRARGPGKTAKADCKRCAGTPPFERCSPNDLRRTLGVLLRARGVEPQLIAPMLGHADSRMVEIVYGRIQPESLAHLIGVRLAAFSSGASRGPAKRKTG